MAEDGQRETPSVTAVAVVSALALVIAGTVVQTLLFVKRGMQTEKR